MNDMVAPCFYTPFSWKFAFLVVLDLLLDNTAASKQFANPLYYV